MATTIDRSFSPLFGSRRKQGITLLRLQFLESERRRILAYVLDGTPPRGLRPICRYNVVAPSGLSICQLGDSQMALTLRFREPAGASPGPKFAGEFA